MNFSLAREIYGGAVWMVDGVAFTALKAMFNDMRKGVSLQAKELKNNSIDIFDVKSATRIITDVWQLNKDTAGDELIYVINLNGVITKNGGASTYGTKQLAETMAALEADSRVIGGIMYTDSGGGSGFGMEVMMHAIAERKKPLVTLVERGGVMASAAYGIASATDWIISESKKAIVGSIGTMTEIAGIPSGERNGNNEKEFRFYASKSVNKNKYWEDVVNDDNSDLIISEHLDPANEDFIKSVKANRPMVLESQLDGSIYKAGEVVGTLIDQIGTFQDAVNKVFELSKTPKYAQQKSNSNFNTNNTAMTAEEFKQQHPAVHQQVYAAGVQAGIKAEKDRAGSWLAHAETDLPAVKKGIEDGGAITATARENFLVKASAATKLDELKNGSPKNVVTPEAENEKTEEKTEAEAFYADVVNGLK